MVERHQRMAEIHLAPLAVAILKGRARAPGDVAVLVKHLVAVVTVPDLGLGADSLGAVINVHTLSFTDHEDCFRSSLEELDRKLVWRQPKVFPDLAKLGSLHAIASICRS